MEDKPNYYAIIPANVRYDKNLTSNEKIFYGEITALTQSTGECWATNSYFSNLYKMTNQSVSRCIKHLKDKGYINVELIYKEKTKEIEKRIITLPININGNTYKQKCYEGININVKENNTSINNINNIYSPAKQDNIPYEEVINYLNEKVGTHFKSNTTKTKTLIKARFKEGFTLEDFKTVIDKKKDQWTGTEWEIYLRPDTLFGTKFESYLNEKTKVKEEKFYYDVQVY